MTQELTYREKIIYGALELVVKAGSFPGEDGGVVDLPVAVEGLLAAIATLAVQSGNYAKPRDARLFAESCEKVLRSAMQEIAAIEVDWKLAPIGPLN